jgi:hypothetical protein
MRNKLYVVFSVAALMAMSCSDKQGGRPAPNSSPVAPQQAPPPAPQPNNQSGQTPNTNNNNNTGTTQAPPPLTGQPPARPGSGNNSGGNTGNNNGQTPTIINSRVIYFNNEGYPQDASIESEAFFVDNYDGVNLPHTRTLTIISSQGQKKSYSGKDFTRLYDQNYPACGNPDCINKITTNSDYSKFAQSCLAQTLTNKVAKFEFYFTKKGMLWFKATIDDVYYGAKNIAYTYDGERELHIAPFVASAVINNNENVAISISGVPLNGEGTDSIRLLRNVSTDAKAFRVKANVEVVSGKVEEGRFVTKGIEPLYLSGVGTRLRPVNAQAFRTLDVQE